MAGSSKLFIHIANYISPAFHVSLYNSVLTLPVVCAEKLVLVFVGMLLSILLIAWVLCSSWLRNFNDLNCNVTHSALHRLDQTILAPAIPVIASQFQALDQLAWIASAYFLTQAALLLLYGQILSVFDGKIVYIMAISIFEVGKRRILFKSSRRSQYTSLTHEINIRHDPQGQLFVPLRPTLISWSLDVQ